MRTLAAPAAESRSGDERSAIMPAYQREEALAFIEALRLTLAGKVGFRWMVDKLSDLSAFVESMAAENERLNAYLDTAGARQDYQAYVEARSGTSDLPDRESDAEGPTDAAQPPLGGS